LFQSGKKPAGQNDLGIVLSGPDKEIGRLNAIEIPIGPNR
jgi:hypothetical protein